MNVGRQIQAFLRLRPPRANPAVVRVEWRHVDPPGSPWRTIYDAPPQSVLPLVTTASKTYGGGKPILLRAGEEVWFASSGFLKLLGAPRWTYNEESRQWARQRSWPDAWESCREPLWLLHGAAPYVSSGLVARAIVDLIRPALGLLPGRVFSAALAELDRWAQGELAAEAIPAGQADLVAATKLAVAQGGAASMAATAVVRAATIPLIESDPGVADARITETATDAIARVSLIPGAEPASMADVVRARIPLSAVLRGLSGL